MRLALALILLVLGVTVAGAVAGAGTRQDVPSGDPGDAAPLTPTTTEAPPPQPPGPAQPGAPTPTGSAPQTPSTEENGPPEIAWPVLPSHALGAPWAGRLVRGVQLPEWGDDFLTWDPVLKQTPNRPWRRWGTDRLVRRLLKVLREYRAAHPDAPRVLVGDLSRPQGGVFDRRFGGLGHGSHQNGLDVDVYYPRKDRLPLAAKRPSQVDHRLAQALVNLFAAAGARYVFVGPHLGLRRVRRNVVPLVHHDDHLHFRFAR